MGQEEGSHLFQCKIIRVVLGGEKDERKLIEIYPLSTHPLSLYHFLHYFSYLSLPLAFFK